MKSRLQNCVVLGLLAFLCASKATAQVEAPFVVVLGIAQDAGFPQAACEKSCCAAAWKDAALRKLVSCLAVVDPATGQRWIIDATPDFKEQLRILDEVLPASTSPGLDGVFLTHGHIGHYTGLMHLGREVIGARSVPVYAMPRMVTYLKSNGPWGQLVELKNIVLRPLQDGQEVQINEHLSITPFLVPHRDEYTETVGYKISGSRHSALFIPDIDKWDKLKTPIETLIRDVDAAYIDGSFFADGELPGRNMAEIPHPFISESMERFSKLPAAEKSKIRFIHFNHTNPALLADSPARTVIKARGFRVAMEGERFEL